EFPAKTNAAAIIEHAVLPHCREFGLPFALMPGVRRAVNPQLKLAGDGVGLTDLTMLQNLCAQFPANKFLVTILARENQHELCVLARKFRNLHIFGCWWFTNVPLLVEEITRMRLELLGLSFTPQHSDARILDQVVYKWQHSRRVIARILAAQYTQLAQSGWQTSRAEVERDVQQLFGGAFEKFCAQ
ncbi:MAG TPA: glucuronate isomerase, partial [Verrucomicrobiae bacterium]|nr:glucuronate isomerase [Verrucomicrobiae bacterium]